MKSIKLLIIALIIILPGFLFANTGSFNWDPIIGLLGLIVAPFLAKLTAKLFKKLNIDVDTVALEAAFAEAWKLISQVEKLYKEGKIEPEERLPYVVDKIRKVLPQKTISITEKRFGSVDNFVEAAFQKSSVANKGGK